MSNKSIIIPDDIKSEIDEILEEELFNANRKHVQQDIFLKRKMEALYKIRPRCFYKELVERWEWHNHFYEDKFESAFVYISFWDLNQVGVNCLKILKKIYETMEQVDMATIVTSGAIKGYLSCNVAKYVKNSYEYSREDSVFMLLTPPHDTFFVEYFYEHLLLILKKRKNKNVMQYGGYLMKKYHGDDKLIFESRYRKEFEEYEKYSVEEIEDSIKGIKIENEYKIKHFYYVIENEERKAFSKIVLYDNYQEKMLGKSLVGISGFLYRKKILKYFNDTGMLKNDGNIYNVTSEEMLKTFERLIEERKNRMIKNVEHFPQNTPVTCAVCCLMMVQKYYGIIDSMDYNLEKKYYGRYSSRFTDGASFASISYEMVHNGLKVELFHSERDMFKNDSYLDTHTYELLMDEYADWISKCDNKLKVVNGINICNELISKKLEDDYIVIAAGHVGMALHAILISGYDRNEYVVCDPIRQNGTRLKCKEMTDYLRTPIGSWMIAVKKDEIPVNELEDCLDKFNSDAKQYLG